MIRSYVANGLRLEKALSIAKLSRSTYYYQPNGQKKGQPASKTTVYGECSIGNEQVVEKIKEILAPEFIDYGYKRTTAVLKELGYQIGKAKVYRLMRENHLLNQPKKKSHPIQQFTVYTSPQPDRPFHILEIDIKYVYIHGERKNGYLITILDTFHRQAYEWGLFRNMKTDRVIELIIRLVDHHLIPNLIDPSKVEIILRTDHGSQFTSIKYQDLMEHLKMERQYIPLATPQMNGHIEGFHSTVQQLVCDKYYFQSFSEATTVFERFFHTYNHVRIMNSILNKRPAQFLDLWKQGKIGYLKVNGKNRFFFKEEGTTSVVPSTPKIC